MATNPTRRQVLKCSGATVAMTGLAGTVSGLEGDHGPVDEALDPARDAPYLVQAVDKFDWEPNHLVVPKGATVTWLGNMAPHTVTSADTLLDAANCVYNGDGKASDCSLGQKATVETPDDAFNLCLGSSQTVEITFDAAGQFPYWCEPHCDQAMIGKIVVVEP